MAANFFVPGQKVVYKGPDTPHLRTNETYFVERCLAAAFQSIVYLKDHPGQVYDGDNFAPYVEMVEPPPVALVSVPDNQIEPLPEQIGSAFTVNLDQALETAKRLDLKPGSLIHIKSDDVGWEELYPLKTKLEEAVGGKVMVMLTGKDDDISVLSRDQIVDLIKKLKEYLRHA